ncbi:MAG: 2-amino-4-hydroxy-6-hydroxymethyldihydropteridine diphosphokinase [Propionibacteriaceae bacterium]|jgi:dihydroneopterin aldolase/2-amino-4-hydroxy-6-hydroxymethyldihydropteridine diphosphokinase|nr:2-amino-4-hydroxy-6-hydroxymethyldihydropteridine diphosphokinase [Propionibacteriaceae bacterium]
MSTFDDQYRLEIAGIEVWAYHGVYPEERRDGAPFLIDLTWWADLTAAASRDDLGLTVDYSVVVDAVVELVQADPVNLIETLAARLQTALTQRFGFTALQVRVHKPQAPLTVTFADLAVTTPLGVAPREVVFSLGSNIEPCQDYIQLGCTALAATSGIRDVRVSALYQTAPVSPVEQADFLNAILIANSTLSAPALLARAHAIEALARRTREIVSGPRSLDIDLIKVGGQTWNTPELSLPHPRAAERAFVIVPWLELDPGATLSGVPIKDLSAALTAQPIRRTEGRLFLP